MDEKIKIVIDGQRGDVVARAGGIRTVNFNEANPNLALVRVSSAILFPSASIRSSSTDQLNAIVRIDVLSF